eukprot:m.27203 g.27203  ORF g.27203 m.27203 type:complete len:299 (-) comp6400_c0_seq2:1512-2408(-)
MSTPRVRKSKSNASKSTRKVPAVKDSVVSDDVLAHYARALQGGKHKRKSKNAKTTDPSTLTSAPPLASPASPGERRDSDDKPGKEHKSGTKPISPSPFGSTKASLAQPVQVISERRRRGPAEVVVFTDPSATLLRQTSIEKKGKRLFMSSDAGKVHAVVNAQPSQAVTGDAAQDAEDAANDIDLKRATDELLRLSASQKEANAMRRWEVGRLQQLGARGPKNMNVPLEIHRGKKKKAKEREAKELARAVETGMATKKGKRKEKFQAGKRSVKGGHWVDKSSIEDTRFRKGVLRVTGTL